MKKKNLINCIEKSVGTNMFQNYYVNGIDVLENGDLSCAYYLSSILFIQGLITNPHLTVKGTLKDMENAGWVKIPRAKVGCVVIWGSVHQNGADHKHMGFFIGKGKAISNRSSLGKPGVHHLHYTGLDKHHKKRRAPILFKYWHPFLD